MLNLERYYNIQGIKQLKFEAMYNQIFGFVKFGSNMHWSSLI